MLFFPWYDATMLAFESNSVVGLRLMRLSAGGTAALDECCLMLSEKISAAFEAGTTMRSGGTAKAVIDRYREHVAANAGRLS